MVVQEQHHCSMLLASSSALINNWRAASATPIYQQHASIPAPNRCRCFACTWLAGARVSLLYEGVIGAIRDELAAVRKQAAAAMAAAGAAEQRVRDSMYYSRDRFTKMEEEVKRMAQVGMAIASCGLVWRWSGRLWAAQLLFCCLPCQKLRCCAFSTHLGAGWACGAAAGLRR